MSKKKPTAKTPLVPQKQKMQQQSLNLEAKRMSKKDVEKEIEKIKDIDKSPPTKKAFLAKIEKMNTKHKENFNKAWEKIQKTEKSQKQKVIQAKKEYQSHPSAAVQSFNLSRAKASKKFFVAERKLKETKKIKEQFGNAKTYAEQNAAIKEFESKNPSKMKRVKEAVKAKFSGLFKNTEVKKKAGNLSPKSGVGQQKKTQQKQK